MHHLPNVRRRPQFLWRGGHGRSWRIQHFTEKPKREEATSNWINAGTYILEPEVLAHIPTGEFHMVERGLFPDLLKEGKPLYGYRTGAYWLDIGTPAKYLQAHTDLLAGRLKHSLEPKGALFADGVWAGEGTFIHSGARVTGPVVLGKGCKVHEGASITGPSALADGCEVGEEAQLENIVAWQGATFEAHSHCCSSIVGTNAKIGTECRLEGVVIVGDDVILGQGNHLANGAKVWPGVHPTGSFHKLLEQVTNAVGLTHTNHRPSSIRKYCGSKSSVHNACSPIILSDRNNVVSEDYF